MTIDISMVMIKMYFSTHFSSHNHIFKFRLFCRLSGFKQLDKVDRSNSNRYSVFQAAFIELNL